MTEEKNNVTEAEDNSNFLTDIIESDLAAGRVKKIHTRFPPEPNGYLHIGSAKAIYINYTSAKKYNGLFNLRFDDTNPTKEDNEYVESIMEDLKWLGANPDEVFYGSDYFQKTYEFAVELIKKGKAYVCDLKGDEMREYRGTLTEPGKNSPYRDRSVEENLELFEKMKNGECQIHGIPDPVAEIDWAAADGSEQAVLCGVLVLRPEHIPVAAVQLVLINGVIRIFQQMLGKAPFLFGHKIVAASGNR